MTHRLPWHATNGASLYYCSSLFRRITVYTNKVFSVSEQDEKTNLLNKYNSHEKLRAEHIPRLFFIRKMKDKDWAVSLHSALLFVRSPWTLYESMFIRSYSCLTRQCIMEAVRQQRSAEQIQPQATFRTDRGVCLTRQSAIFAYSLISAGQVKYSHGAQQQFPLGQSTHGHCRSLRALRRQVWLCGKQRRSHFR